MSNSSEFKPDDIIDITIRRARVVRSGQDDIGRSYIQYTHGEVNTLASVDSEDPDVTVERIVSAEWPPRPGDLWREVKGGGLWFIFRDPSVMNPSQSGLRAREANGDRWTDDALRLLRDCAPLALVHREAERDGGNS